MTDLANLIARVLLVMCIYGCLGASAAQAETINKLTEENLRAFIEKTSVITAGHESEMSQEEIDAYLIEHIDDKARFKSTMRYNIPGFDLQETSMSVSKKEFIESVDKATESVSEYESQIKILEINISKDGKKATVKTQTHESGMMPVADETNEEEVPMEGSSTCIQILTLSKKGVIQMFNATCATDIEFDTFAP